MNKILNLPKDKKKKNYKKIIKKTKTSKTSDLSAGGVSLPKPTKRIKRKKGARVNVGALLASRGR